MRLTHAYVHRLADVHLAGFAPAFTLSLCDSEYARKPPVPIASVVRWHSKKRKKTDSVAQKSLTNCPLLRHKQTSFIIANLRFFVHLLSGQFLADFKGKNWTFSFWDYEQLTNEIMEMAISDLNIRKRNSIFSDFAHWRAESGFRQLDKKRDLTNWLLFFREFVRLRAESGLRTNLTKRQKRNTNSLTTRKKRKPVSGCRESA